MDEVVWGSLRQINDEKSSYSDGNTVVQNLNVLLSKTAYGVGILGMSIFLCLPSYKFLLLTVYDVQFTCVGC